MGIDSIATFQSFRERCERLRRELSDFVRGEVARGRVFHLYGASTKGNTILQYCGLDHRLIAAAADRNPEKWGARTPATNIPIISEANHEVRDRTTSWCCPGISARNSWRARRRSALRGGSLSFPTRASIV